jgi:hypothetical protein
VLDTGDFAYLPAFSTHNISRVDEGPIKYFVIQRLNSERVTEPGYTIDDCIRRPAEDSVWVEKGGMLTLLDTGFPDRIEVNLYHYTKKKEFSLWEGSDETYDRAVFIVSGFTANPKSPSNARTKIGPNDLWYNNGDNFPDVFIYNSDEEPLVFLEIKAN